MAIITGEIEYLTLRKVRAHYEMEISENSLKAFKELPRTIQAEKLQDAGTLIVDDWRIEDIGDIFEINY